MRIRFEVIPFVQDAGKAFFCSQMLLLYHVFLFGRRLIMVQP